MTSEEIIQCFKDNKELYLEESKIKNRLHKRLDLNALLLLSNILPETEIDIIAGAEHDEIYLEAFISKLEETNITKELIKDLICCGVLLNENEKDLMMNV